MKTTLKEELYNFKRLLGEATTTASSGAYVQPLGFDQVQPKSICQRTGQPLVGTEIGSSAPNVNVVDVTQRGVLTPPAPTEFDGGYTQPVSDFDSMPFLSSHPSEWSFDGDEEELLRTHGLERPVNPNNDMEYDVRIDNSTYDNDEEEEMSAAFDEMDDGTDVFQQLKMMQETTKGLGW
tara:strand:- start:261 stop:797 length:537 start_codon:yes stop_codon:yes gene_type:complete